MQEFTGMDYIRIDIANQFGMDKLTWDERISWVKDNDVNLEAFTQFADKKVLFSKAVRAYRGALKGIPTGFVMGLDATASGIQIMAALVGCKKTAQCVNLVDTGKREDVYILIADETGTSRDVIKKPTMTTFYGSTKQPEDVFGAGTQELHDFYQALYTLLPGAMDCMEFMQACWQPNALDHTWTLPDGHVAKIKVMEAVEKKIEVDELDHSTFTYRAYVNKPVKKGLSLAANIVHSIDGWIVREMYRRAEEQGFELLTIHDSFWASPNYMNNVRKNYRDILVEIAESDMLEAILREITGSNLTITKTGDITKYVRQAEYALS